MKKKSDLNLRERLNPFKVLELKIFKYIKNLVLKLLDQQSHFYSPYEI